MIQHSFAKVLDNYKKLLASGVGLARPSVVSGSENSSGINLHIHQLTLHDYHKNMHHTDKEMAYHIAGYGQTIEESLTRAMGETIERYSLMSLYYLLSERIIYTTYSNLKKNNNVLPLEFVNTIDPNNQNFRGLNENQMSYWMKLKNYVTNEEIFYPLALICRNPFDKNPVVPTMSTGTATHISYEQAICNAIIEALQIHNFMIAWYTKQKLPVLNWEPFVSNSFKEIINKTFNNYKDFEIIVLDNSVNDMIANYITIIRNTKNRYPYYTFGIQGGLNREYTLLRSMMEAAAIYINVQYFLIYKHGQISLLTSEKVKQSYNLDDSFLYWSNYNERELKENYIKDIISSKQIDFTPKCFTKDEEIKILLKYAKENLKYFSLLEITPPELIKYGYKSVRAIAPELYPMCFPALPYIHNKHLMNKGGVKNDCFTHPLP